MSRPLLIAMLLLLAVASAHSQKIERYYTFNWHDTTAVNARFYSVLEKTDSGWHRKDYFLHSLALQMEGLYEDSACKIPSGSFHFFHATRIVSSMGSYRHGKKQGIWLGFYSNGMMKDSIVYEMGNRIGTSLSWHRNGYLSDSAWYGPDGSGIAVSWFDNGNPAAAGRYAAGYKKQGRWQYFYKQGRISAVELYEQGKLKDRQYANEQGAPMDDTTNKARETEFPGGQKAWTKYLGKALYFPPQYRFTDGDQAAVIVDATIDEEGKVVDAEVSVPFYPAFDKIALEAIRKSPNWIPASEYNRKIKTEIHQPIIFRLE